MMPGPKGFLVQPGEMALGWVGGPGFRLLHRFFMIGGHGRGRGGAGECSFLLSLPPWEWAAVARQKTAQWYLFRSSRCFQSVRMKGRAVLFSASAVSAGH